MSSSVSNAITPSNSEYESFRGCDADAHSFADYIYRRTNGDSFAAGRAFVIAYDACVRRNQ